METKLYFNKKQNQYYIRVEINGKRRRKFAKVGMTEKEARAYLLPQDIYIAAVEAALELKKGSLRAGTYKMYACSLRRFKDFYAPFPDKTNVKAVTAGFLAYLRERKCTDKTILNYFRAINALTTATVEFGLTDFVLKLKTKLRPEAKPAPAFTAAEIEALKPILKTRRDMSLYCKLQYFCFIRPGEIAQLRARDFDLPNGLIYVPADVSKNRRGAHVVIPPAYTAELSAALAGAAFGILGVNTPHARRLSVNVHRLLRLLVFFFDFRLTPNKPGALSL